MTFTIRTFLCALCLFGFSPAPAGTAKQIGDTGRYAAPIMAALIIVSQRDWTGAQQFSASLLSSLALTHVLKRSINEERPRPGSRNAFPSGHTMWAFSGASYVHRRYGLPYSLPLFFIASAVGFSRVDVGAHHVHDVLAAAVLSSAAAYLFTKPLESDNLIATTSASLSPHGIGLSLNINVKL